MNSETTMPPDNFQSNQPNQPPELIKETGKTESKTNLVMVIAALSVLIALSLIASTLLIRRAQEKHRAPMPPTSSQRLPQNPTSAPTVSENSGLSDNDSIQTIEKELDQTPIDDFSQDFQQIDQDVNAL